MAIRRDVPGHAPIAAELLTGHATNTLGSDVTIAGTYLMGTHAGCAAVATLRAHARKGTLTGGIYMAVPQDRTRLPSLERSRSSRAMGESWFASTSAVATGSVFGS
jgi:hypothetical protein